MSNGFDFNVPERHSRPTSTRHGRPAGSGWLGEWLSRFSATLAAIVIGGILFGLVMREYLHWSVRSAIHDVEQRYDDQKPMK